MGTDKQSPVEQLLAELHAARVDLASYHKHTIEKLGTLTNELHEQSAAVGTIKTWVVTMGIVVLVGGVAAACLLFAVIISCGGCGSKQPSDSASQATERHTKMPAPFEYTLVSREEMEHDWGPQVVVKLETTSEVAIRATKDDLAKLWQHLLPTFGDCRVWVYLKEPNSDALPWGIISRIWNREEGVWKVEFEFNEIGNVRDREAAKY